MKPKVFPLGLAMLAWAAASILQVRAATVTATLDPAEISLGDSAQLTVTVSGAQDQAERPAVDGLEITPVGQSTQIEVVNGAMTANASSTYAVTPQHEGTFVIPAIHAGNAASQPITLRVGQGAIVNPAPTSPTPGTGPVVMPSPQILTTPSQAPVTADKFGSIEITIPKKEFYEGEVVPVDIKVYVPADVQASVSDLPQFTSEGFTLNSLSTKLNQSQEESDGRIYDVLLWHSALTAVKTGDYPISIKMPLTVVVMQRIARPNGGDIFDDFFRNAMTSFGTRKNIMLATKPETLKVLPLPQTNRPSDFSGAIGQFEMEASATPTHINAGDPITLQMKITGTGNFDRVSSNMLAASAQWKTYSPKSTFAAVDGVGCQGTKTFEQPAIASDSSVTSVPSLTFSFFDPEKRQYVTRTTAPIVVSVTGGTINPVASAVVPAGNSPTTLPPKPAPVPASDLRPNQIEAGSYVSTLRPIYLNPLFVAGQGLPLLALVSVLMLVRSRRLAARPERTQSTAAQREIRQQVDAMDAAMHDHKAGLFFIHGRSALQQKFGQRWNMRPETITVSDVEAHIGEDSVNLKTIFHMADQARYSDLVFGDSDLLQWRQIVMNELEKK